MALLQVSWRRDLGWQRWASRPGSVLGSTTAELVHLLDRPVAVVRGAVTTGPVVLGLAGTFHATCPVAVVPAGRLAPAPNDALGAPRALNDAFGA